jgi:hypothetical protein
MSEYCQNCDEYLTHDHEAAVAMGDIDGFVTFTYGGPDGIEYEEYCSPSCLAEVHL